MTFKFTFPATFFQQLTSTRCVSRSVSELHVPVHNAIDVMNIITGLFSRFVLLRGRRLWECLTMKINRRIIFGEILFKNPRAFI